MSVVPAEIVATQGSLSLDIPKVCGLPKQLEGLLALWRGNLLWGRVARTAE